MEVQIFKTDGKKAQFARDLAVYSDYVELMSIPGQSSTEVCKHLMKKYNIYSPATIYAILKRVRHYQKEGKA